MTVEEYSKSCDELIGKLGPLSKEFENYAKEMRLEMGKLKELRDSFETKNNQYLENKTQDNHISTLMARIECLEHELKIKDIYIKCDNLKIQLAREEIQNDCIYQSALEDANEKLSQIVDELTNTVKGALTTLESFDIDSIDEE